MKRFAAITMVLILSFAMFTSAVAETKGFRFAKLNRSGAAYEETAIKAGGSKYPPTTNIALVLLYAVSNYFGTSLQSTLY